MFSHRRNSMGAKGSRDLDFRGLGYEPQLYLRPFYLFPHIVELRICRHLQ